MSNAATVVTDSKPNATLNSEVRRMEAYMNEVRAMVTFGTIGFDAYLVEVVADGRASLTLPVLSSDWLALING